MGPEDPCPDGPATREPAAAQRACFEPSRLRTLSPPDGPCAALMDTPPCRRRRGPAALMDTLRAAPMDRLRRWTPCPHGPAILSCSDEHRALQRAFGSDDGTSAPMGRLLRWAPRPHGLASHQPFLHITSFPPGAPAGRVRAHLPAAVCTIWATQSPPSPHTV